MSTTPIQRIAELEAQNSALAAENQSLRANGNARVAIDTLIADSFERFGRLFREDLVVKVSHHITPFIENTMRRCQDTEEKQTALEERFKAHEEAVGKVANGMIIAIANLRVDAEKGWKAHRTQIQSDFAQVDKFVNWFRGEMERSAQENQAAVTNCGLAVRSGSDLLRKLNKPVEEVVEYLNGLKAHGRTIVNDAADDLSLTYRRLRQPILKRVTILLAAVVFVYLGMGAFVLWRVRTVIDTNWQELTEHSEQQKTEMKELLDKTIEEAKESQIDREMKVKMWDSWMTTLTPQQKQTVIEKLRWQVNKAEQDRLGDQMISSHEMMEGKRK